MREHAPVSYLHCLAVVHDVLFLIDGYLATSSARRDPRIFHVHPVPFKQRSFPILLALATLLLAWTLTFVVWHATRTSAEAQHRAEFASLMQESTAQIARRMGVYEQILRASRGFMRNSVQVSRDEFREYVRNLDLNRYFPGIRGIGIAEIVQPAERATHIERVRQQGFPDYEVWPEGDRPIYTAITKLEPLDEMNRRALGFDMYSNPVRQRAMARARDTGNAALSGKVILVQEGQEDVQAGFLMYLPIYASDMPTATEAQRRAAILGWIYAPFRVRDFMRSLSGLAARELDLTIYDGGVMSAELCMYGCDAANRPPPMLRATEEMVIAGRRWLVDVRSTPAFEARLETATPRLILGGGLLTGLLLATIVWALAAGRGRALALAQAMTHELRLSHDKIEADQRRMHSILENALDAFVATDKDGVVTDWNAAATRMFGWTAAEAIGQRLESLIFLENDAQDQQERHADDTVFPGRTLFPGPGEHQRRMEVTVRRRDGRLIPAELTLATVEDEAGFVAHGFIRDLTEQKAMQQREARHRKTLDETRAALQHAQRLEAVGKLTGGVAHDFNNVLQIISGNIQLIQHVAGGNPALDARLVSAMQAVDRGAKLSSQLLSFARRQPLQPRVVNLRPLLQNMQELIRRAVGEEVDIEVASVDDLWNTTVDRTQFENVVLNLVINARDAMGSRGKLTIELDNVALDDDYALAFPEAKPGHYVMLAVSDTGGGMTREVMEHAFEPFFTTKRQGEGTGLGLSMAYGFVKQSEGHIRLYSEAGFGTTVRIYLPCSKQPEADGADTSTHIAPAPGGRETILVVEDDLGVQATVVTMLSQLGYRVLKADNGEQGSVLLRQGHHIDLLFTDVVMPGAVTSTDLAREAKAVYPGIAVLFTSGFTQDTIVHGGRLDPGVHLLSKPYRRDELARQVRWVLDHREEARAPEVNRA